MDNLIKTKLINVVKSEARYLLGDEELENKLNELNDLYVIRRVLENYEELENMLKEYVSKKDKERMRKKNEDKER